MRKRRKAKKKRVINLLSKHKISRAVSCIDSFGAAPLEVPEVREQVAAKYPERKKVIHMDLPKASPVDNLKGLKENLLCLKKGTAEQDSICPLGIRNPLLKSFHREVINGSKGELLAFLEPQQLIHSVRMLLEENPDFVCATNDCRNAFNESARATAVTALQQEPSLAHLAYYAATTFLPSQSMESRGKLWGRAGDGPTQGSLEAESLFAIQKYLVELDSTLAAVGDGKRGVG